MADLHVCSICGTESIHGVDHPNCVGWDLFDRWLKDPDHPEREEMDLVEAAKLYASDG